MTSIRHLPLREMLRAFRALRRQWFRVPWPAGIDEVVVHDDPDVVEWALRSDLHFESGVTMSYYYDGEVLNLRRPEGLEVVDGSDVQMQLHIRARERPDGSWGYVGHVEPDPDEHPRLHIDEVGFRWEQGVTREVLDSAGVALDGDQ